MQPYGGVQVDSGMSGGFHLEMYLLVQTVDSYIAIYTLGKYKNWKVP